MLAGPAEGFARDSVGRIVGIESGQPCLQLDDLIVALRAFGPTAEATTTISVSIDPTQEGLARMQQTLRQLGGTFRGPNDIPVIVRSLQQSLGLNEVSIRGVPAGTHFAHVLAEADYRMKLIGIGLQPAPVQMTNYVDRLTSAMGSSNALVRWYFVPDYEAVSVSEDGLAMQLVGGGIKLIDEGELVQQSGRRSTGVRANAASRGFTAEFTKKFPLIAKHEPVYAQRNLVDLSIVAAYIQQSKMYELCNWDLGLFGDEDRLAVELLPPPERVETAINAVMRDATLITPIGGGVAIQARRALRAENVRKDANGQVAEMRGKVTVDQLNDEQWWWD